MNELAELAGLRAEVAGNRPEDLPRAREMLNAQIRAASDPGRRHLVAWLWSCRSPSLRGRRRILASHLAGGPRVRPRPVTALAAAGIAVILAAAVTIGLLTGLPGRPGGSTVRTAAYVLERAASAAARRHQPVPRPGQYIFVASVGTSMAEGDQGTKAARSWLTVYSFRVWWSADGRKEGVGRNTLLRNERLPWGGPVPAAGRQRVSWFPMPAEGCPGAPPLRLIYDYLTTLPTNPAQLRTWIYGHKNGGQNADDQAWTDIGDLLQGILVPPKLAAALFKVAASIPGATVVPHATDAAGRVGIAVARVGPWKAQDTELIFDPHTYRFLGVRSTLVAPAKKVGPAGTVIESTAQLKVAVVSHLPRPLASARPGTDLGASSSGC